MGTAQTSSYLVRRLVRVVQNIFLRSSKQQHSCTFILTKNKTALYTVAFINEIEINYADVYILKIATVPAATQLPQRL